MFRVTPLMLTLVFTAGAAAETLESVEQKLVSLYEKHKSMSAKMDMTMEMGPGMKGESEGTVEFMRDGDKEKIRTEMNMAMDMGGQKMNSTVLSIFDGEFSYTLTEMMGQKNAMKMKADDVQGRMGGKQMFESLRKDHDLVLLPEEKVDGRDTYVVEATRKTASPQGPAKMRMFFDKEIGAAVKVLGMDTGGSTMMTVLMKDIKLNPTLDPARFVFTAPDGVQVMDMTNQ